MSGNLPIRFVARARVRRVKKDVEVTEITIPKELVTSLNIKPGTYLEVQINRILFTQE
jgi:antitoxin component of MazEF toxin-antitoxin module